MAIEQRHRFLQEPTKLEEMGTKESVRRLNLILLDIVKKINELHTVRTMPIPTGLSRIEGTGFIAIYWDDVPDEYRASVDGIRIYRADSDENAETDFGKNDSAQILVNCLRTTRYVDVEDTGSGNYIYWVRWVNLNGSPGPIAGGIEATIGG